MMRQAFRHAAFEGVTSHYFRKTVATLQGFPRDRPPTNLGTPNSR
jgi:hypothetical protein